MTPRATAAQNRTRCSRRPAGGRPGERITGRPVRSDAHPFGLPIATPFDRVLRRPLESAQYTSIDYTQVLTDHRVLASIGTVGDALDNAMAESFVDSYKTELIADRVWRTRSQVELATVKWVAWFNHQRLHESLGDIPPAEFEALHADNTALDPPISVDGSVASISSKGADGLRTRRFSPADVDLALDRLISTPNAALLEAGSAQAAPQAGQR